MFQPVRAAFGLAIFLTLLATPVHATNIYYVISLPGIGSGSLRYDNASITSVGNGNWNAPLTDFSFTFAGGTYRLSDATSKLVWFMDPEQRFVGIQYITTSKPTNIEFAAGSGDGDLGTFTSMGGIDIDPVPLTDENFINAPELDAGSAPGALLLLAGALCLSHERRRSRGVA
jgi:hypothetical protein